jgi:acyl-CoA thioesterase
MQLSEVIADLTDDGAADDGYTAQPPADRRQGRTLYGGLTAALCAVAGRRAAGPSAPLRSLQLAFIAPAAGRLRTVPTLLRRGRSAAFVGVEVSAEDDICARATLVYGVARDSDSGHDHAPAPQVLSPAQCAPLPIGADAPTFMGHFEVRHAGGGLPFSGARPEFVMWARHRDSSGVDPTIALVAIADVLPPAAAVASPTSRPVSSVTWSLDLVQPTPPTEWYLLRSASQYSADGYSLQTMGCWDESGRCLALGAQLVAVF